MQSKKGCHIGDVSWRLMHVLYTCCVLLTKYVKQDLSVRMNTEHPNLKNYKPFENSLVSLM